jgi:hypothetical protein
MTVLVTDVTVVLWLLRLGLLPRLLWIPLLPRLSALPVLSACSGFAVRTFPVRFEANFIHVIERCAERGVCLW